LGSRIGNILAVRLAISGADESCFRAVASIGDDLLSSLVNHHVAIQATLSSELAGTLRILDRLHGQALAGGVETYLDRRLARRNSPIFIRLST
jgi:hypothetical protein